MTSIRDQAVVLTRLDFSESSQVLVLFCRDNGKIRAIAKGIKRGTKTRFATGVDVLDIGHVVLSGRQRGGASLAIITEWKQTLAMGGLRESLRRIHAAEYAAEITAGLTEDWDPHASLYDAFVATLATMAESDDPLAELVRYQITLLDQTGLLPRFDRCVHCGRSAELTHFSSFDGGCICQRCEASQIEKWEISPDALRVIRSFAGRADCGANAYAPEVAEGNRGRAVPTPADSAVSNAFATLNYHLTHVMGRALKLSRFLSAPTGPKK